jgi:hypothetical protein
MAVTGGYGEVAQWNYLWIYGGRRRQEITATRKMMLRYEINNQNDPTSTTANHEADCRKNAKFDE